MPAAQKVTWSPDNIVLERFTPIEVSVKALNHTFDWPFDYCKLIQLAVNPLVGLVR